MKIKIFISGKIKSSEILNLVNYYLKLASKYSEIKIESVRFPEESKIKFVEIEKYFKTGFNILLSEHGRISSTEDFAQSLKQWEFSHKQINFFVANAFGFEDEIYKNADHTHSLSPMTFAHEHATLILCEQLFRCLNLNAGGKYHK